MVVRRDPKSNLTQVAHRLQDVYQSQNQQIAARDVRQK